MALQRAEIDRCNRLMVHTTADADRTELEALRAQVRRLEARQTPTPVSNLADPDGLVTPNLTVGRVAMTKSAIDLIPSFKGIQDTEIFPAWIYKVDTFVRDHGEVEGKALLMTKVECDAYEYVAAMIDEPWEEIRRQLTELYDPTAGQVGACTAWNKLAQGSDSIVAHNALVRKIFRHAGRDLDAVNSEWNIKYIMSLNELPIRRRLTHKMEDKTMRMLMAECWTCTQNNNFACGNQAATAAAASISALHPGNQHQSAATGPSDSHLASLVPDRPRRKDSDKKWCPIHETNSHDLDTCTRAQQDTCGFCRGQMTDGPAAHAASCPATRCNKCKRRGHLERSCMDGVQRPERSRSKDRKTYVKRSDKRQHQDKRGEYKSKQGFKKPRYAKLAASLEAKMAASLQAHIAELQEASDPDTNDSASDPDTDQE